MLSFFQLLYPALSLIAFCLRFPHPAVKSACRKQLLVCPCFGNPPFFHHQNPVRQASRIASSIRWFNTRSINRALTSIVKNGSNADMIFSRNLPITRNFPGACRNDMPVSPCFICTVPLLKQVIYTFLFLIFIVPYKNHLELYFPDS